MLPDLRRWPKDPEEQYLQKQRRVAHNQQIRNVRRGLRKQPQGIHKRLGYPSSFATTQQYVPGDFPFTGRFNDDVRLDPSQVRYADEDPAMGRRIRAAGERGDPGVRPLKGGYIATPEWMERQSPTYWIQQWWNGANEIARSPGRAAGNIVRNLLGNQRPKRVVNPVISKQRYADEGAQPPLRIRRPPTQVRR